MTDSNEPKGLVEIYEGFTPEILAELFRLRPKLTTGGLEKLLQNNPNAFAQIVPQAIDPQTGLFSKIYFERNLLPSAIAKAEENRATLTYLSIDLDDFKRINTKYGERNGDEVIKLFSDLLKKSFRSTNRRNKSSISVGQDNRKNDRRRNADSLDYIARVPDKYTHEGRVGGGEEFGVILYGINEIEALNLATTRLLESVRKTQVPYKGGAIRFTFSGGIAQLGKDMTAEQLMLNAMDARTYSKNNGKDRITLYSQIPNK